MDLKSNMSLRMLKQKMEGERRRVNRRPEVYITVREMVMKDEGSIDFSPQEFSLSGLQVHAFVEITGTETQIVKEMGQEAASRLFKKASSLVMGKKPKSKASKEEKATLVGKASSPVSEPQEDAGEEIVQTCIVDLTVRMWKEAADEKVKVQISDLSVGESTFKSATLAKKALGNKRLRAMIEAGISKVAVHALSKKLEKAKSGRVLGCVLRCLRCFRPSR